MLLQNNYLIVKSNNNEKMYSLFKETILRDERNLIICGLKGNSYSDVKELLFKKGYTIYEVSEKDDSGIANLLENTNKRNLSVITAAYCDDSIETQYINRLRNDIVELLYETAYEKAIKDYNTLIEWLDMNTVMNIAKEYDQRHNTSYYRFISECPKSLIEETLIFLNKLFVLSNKANPISFTGMLSHKFALFVNIPKEEDFARINCSFLRQLFKQLYITTESATIAPCHLFMDGITNFKNVKNFLFEYIKYFKKEEVLFTILTNSRTQAKNMQKFISVINLKEQDKLPLSETS